MRHYLIVAHQTLGGAHLMDHVHDLRVADPYCRFHVIVPVQHPIGHAWTDGEVKATARENLEEMLTRLATMGIGAQGEVGDVNPVYAVANTIRRDGEAAYSGILVSTLPRASSHWWRADVPRRIAKAHPNLAVTHLAAEDALVS